MVEVVARVAMTEVVASVAGEEEAGEASTTRGSPIYRAKSVFLDMIHSNLNPTELLATAKR